MKAERILYCIFGVFLFAACSGGEDYEQQLEWFEEMNRTDVPLCVDSVQPLVRHYDHWWHSRNHRMRAYYMLGCAYRDQGEAPAALHYYKLATEEADTASSECDYATLFRVYGQMAMIYGHQNMPQEELEAWERYSLYAKCAGDTANFIFGFAKKVSPYYALDDTMAVLRTSYMAHKLYKKYGYKKQSSDVFHCAIYIYLKQGKLSKAKSLMDEFEKNSGAFNQMGEIERGRELYYEFKGLYYLGINVLDSAEFYYRRLLKTQYKYEAFKGLQTLYTRKKLTDSIVKYTPLCEDALLQWSTACQTNAIIQSAAMYRYERNKNQAEKKAKDARISHQIIALMAATFVIIALFVYILFNRIRLRQQKKDEEYYKLVCEHKKVQEEYHLQYKNLEILQKRYDSLKEQLLTVIASEDEKIQKQMKQMQEEIYHQKMLLNSYRNDVIKKESELKQEDIYIQFQSMAQKKFNGRLPNGKDWDKLFTIYRKYLPHMHARMKVAGLSQQEMRISILTHLDATPTDLMVLLNTSKSTISNAKSEANRKLFGQKSAPTLASNLKKCAYFE